MGKMKGKFKRESRLKGLTPAIRMKGGVRFDSEVKGFVAIVHTWDNAYCIGEPKEWCYPKVYATEDEAMQYYKTTIRPALERMMTKMAEEQQGGKLVYRKLEQ
jgi:hypothetical protein